MKLMKWAKKTVKKMDVCTVSALKSSVFLIGMIAGAYAAMFVKTYIMYFIIVAVALYAIVFYKIFK